ncbi:MAG TPA: hypothetical protein VK506_05765 [Conexibacter sp.]|nr:hypothetical protein [Conexibacter sp.]
MSRARKLKPLLGLVAGLAFVWGTLAAATVVVNPNVIGQTITRTAIYSTGPSSVLTISTNVIAPTNAVHHLGAGLVKTVTVPAACTSTCTLAIVPDAAFTTDTTGNISLASTAVINKVLFLVWDGTKWNPSY